MAVPSRAGGNLNPRPPTYYKTATGDSTDFAPYPWRASPKAGHSVIKACLSAAPGRASLQREVSRPPLSHSVQRADESRSHRRCYRRTDPLLFEPYRPRGPSRTRCRHRRLPGQSPDSNGSWRQPPDESPSLATRSHWYRRRRYSPTGEAAPVYLPDIFTTALVLSQYVTIAGRLLHQHGVLIVDHRTKYVVEYRRPTCNYPAGVARARPYRTENLPHAAPVPVVVVEGSPVVVYVVSLAEGRDEVC